MPVAGAMGAISAANRRARTRQQGGLSQSSASAANKYSIGSSSKQAIFPKSTDDSEIASVESKTSMLSIFKQQVQETTGYLKKQQQALSEKVQKGLKMTSNSTSSTKQSATQEACTASTPQQTTHAAKPVISSLEPAWASALEQMGFSVSEVQQATSILGGQPEQMDDLLQVLTAIRSSSDTTSGQDATEKAASRPDDDSSVVKDAQDRSLRLAAAESRAKVAAASRTSMDDWRRQQPCTASETKAAKPTVQPPSTVHKVQGPSCPPETTSTSKSVAAALPPQPSLAQAHPMPLSTMSAVGSAEFEMATDKHKFMTTAPSKVKSPQQRALSDREFVSLQHMGFDTEAINQATGMVGPKASFEELFGVLLAMGSSLPPKSCAAASSSESLPMDKMAAAAIGEPWEDAPIATTPTASEHKEFAGEETPSRILAAALVRAVLTKVAAKPLLAAATGATECKKMMEPVCSASPVKGGA